MPQSELSKALHSRPFQVQGARFAMQHKRVLIADEPGLGKTLQSIAAVIGCKTTGSVLVVAPKTAVYVTWPAELRRWLADIAPNDIIRIIGGHLKKPERQKAVADILRWELEDRPAGGRQWVIVSPNYLRFKIALDDYGNYVYNDSGNKIITPVREALLPLVSIQWAAVIVDEAHETLSGATGNLKKQSAQSRGLRLLQVADGGLKLALSGTPFRGKHENIWGILNWLDPKTYSAYWSWVNKHFYVYHDSTFDIDVIGNLRSEEALARETKGYMIRRAKKDVVAQLPEKQYGGWPLDPKKLPPQNLSGAEVDTWYYQNNPVAVWLDMPDLQRKAYEQMKREAMADIEGGTVLANSILAELVRLKQFANSLGYLDANGDFQPAMPSNKFDWLVQFLHERGIDSNGPDTDGPKVVVASQFTRHINLFAEKLEKDYGIPCFVLTGATTAQQRMDYQKQFQAGKMFNGKPSPQVFLLNTKAGGVSLTLDAADDCVLIDSTFSPDDQVQVEDRIHRISRIHNVWVWNLCSRGTVDETILKETRTRGTSLKRILDWDSSVTQRLLG